MAVHNGALFLRQQIDSILPQLKAGDELVISDDESRDNTVEIITSYQDPKICLFAESPFGNPTRNFEFALSHCKNDIIFLADQDDIWDPRKIEIMEKELEHCDLVVCDCRLVDANRDELRASFFEWNHSRGGVINNIVKNSFVGCCMAFHRKLLDKILPFPIGGAMHDQWIGLMALRHFRVKFIPQILVDHRRHTGNYSTTGGLSKSSWNKKVISRLQLAKAVLQH